MISSEARDTYKCHDSHREVLIWSTSDIHENLSYWPRWKNFEFRKKAKRVFILTPMHGVMLFYQVAKWHRSLTSMKSWVKQLDSSLTCQYRSRYKKTTATYIHVGLPMRYITICWLNRYNNYVIFCRWRFKLCLWFLLGRQLVERQFTILHQHLKPTTKSQCLREQHNLL